MLQASLADGTAHRPCTFEVFARRLPNERRYGVVAGTARVLRAVQDFVFTEEQLANLSFLDDTTLDYLRNYHFRAILMVTARGIYIFLIRRS